jgi:hypothetical protein
MGRIRPLVKKKKSAVQCLTLGDKVCNLHQTQLFHVQTAHLDDASIYRIFWYINLLYNELLALEKL